MTPTSQPQRRRRKRETPRRNTLKQRSEKAIDANRRRLGIDVEALRAKWADDEPERRQWAATENEWWNTPLLPAELMQHSNTSEQQ